MPGNEGARHAAVAVLKGVDLREPVVESRRHQERVIDIGLRRVLAVPGQQVQDSRLSISESTCSGGRQKSSVVAASSSGAASNRSGQSSAVMSQKRHSCWLGTRAAGLSAESRRIKDPRSFMN